MFGMQSRAAQCLLKYQVRRSVIAKSADESTKTRSFEFSRRNVSFQSLIIMIRILLRIYAKP